MENKIDITYWSDFSCPYCYIGERRMRRALEAEGLEAEITMKAFRLDPSAGIHAESDTASRFARKYGLTLDQAKAQVGAISELGRAEGLDFRYASTLFTNTMDAHRLEKFAAARGKGEETAEALYDAYFCRNLELADRQVLLDAAEGCRLNRGEAARMLDSDEYVEDVLEDEREARSAGIFAVPVFFIGGTVQLSGAAPLASMRMALSRSAESGSGGMCGPEGCKL